MNNLGLVYANMLDAKRAELFYLRAIEIYEKSPQESLKLALTLNNLAQLYLNQRSDAARSEPLIERALSLREKALGPQDPQVAESLLSLSGIYNDRSDARADTLREVQLGMLRSRLLSHPFFWSSFIQSGEWKGMSFPKAGAQ